MPITTAERHTATTLAKGTDLLARRYTLDGEEVDLFDLAQANEWDAGMLEEVRGMEIGQSIDLGGGAFASFTLSREA